MVSTFRAIPSFDSMRRIDVGVEDAVNVPELSGNFIVAADA
jgi:hypothetical protein